MVNLFAKRLRDDLVFFAHSNVVPTDKEWQEILALSDSGIPGVGFRCLVITDGAAPTLKQRKELDARLAHLGGGATALITESMATRALMSAVGWLSGNKLKAFATADLPAAYAFLRVDAAERQLLDAAIAESVQVLGLSIFSKPPLHRSA